MTKSLRLHRSVVRLACLLLCSVFFFATAAQAQLSGFSEPRPRPPSGWTKLDWPEKKAILFGQYAPSEAEVELIRKAMPPAPVAKPDKPRKIFLYYQCKYPHASIATGVKTFELMAEMTGVFEVTTSDDPADFTLDNLQQYDAVLLVNTTSFDQTIGVTGQGALLLYARSGGGVIGVHAAADSCQRWPEGAKLFGGVFTGHPWTAGGTWAFRLESPDHPLNRAFGGEGFRLNDEVYWYRGFSPDRSRVLVSLDMRGDNNRQGKGFQSKFLDQIDPDKQYPVAWIHEYGKGRVFYSNLGHNPTTYWQPKVLAHYLDGIRYALGDLPADATPTSELAEVAYAPAP